MKSTIYLVGCGGVGSWLAPSLCLLTSPEQIVIIDADILEEKNLDRQLFKPDDIGRSKAEALGERYGCRYINQWFSEGLMEFKEDDWLIVCVDNHMARKAALSVCDRYGALAIFAANETHSAEAYFYRNDWRDTPLDPRVYFPDILTDKSNDPRSRAIGCTGEAQKENPQLVTSNSLAASLAGHLFSLWHLHAPTVKRKTIPFLPHRLVANRTRLETHLIKDKLKGQNDEQRPRRDAARETMDNSRPAESSVPGGHESSGVAGPDSGDSINATESTAVDTGTGRAAVVGHEPDIHFGRGVRYG